MSVNTFAPLVACNRERWSHLADAISKQLADVTAAVTSPQPIPEFIMRALEAWCPEQWLRDASVFLGGLPPCVPVVVAYVASSLKVKVVLRLPSDEAMFRFPGLDAFGFYRDNETGEGSVHLWEDAEQEQSATDSDQPVEATVIVRV